MPYLGRPLISDKTTKTKKIDSIASSFNGAQTVFSLNSSGTTVYPASSRNLFVSINGVLQEPDVAYTINAATITFTSAPTTNATFFCVVNGEPNDLLLTPSVTTLTVGANVSMNTTTLLVGNSTVNTIMTATTLTVGANVSVNSTTAFVGNTTVNTAITSGGVTVNGNSPWLSQTFRGLTLRTSPNADVAATTVTLDHADEIVMHDGVRVADWDDLSAAITTSGAGGLDTGSEGASRWYSIHAIRKSSDGTKGLLLHRAKSYDLDQSQTTLTNISAVRYSAAIVQAAQTFTPALTGSMPFSDVALAKVGSPTGQIWLELYATSAGAPTGAALYTSDKLDVSLISTSNQWVRFPWRTPPPVTSGTVYALVVTGNWTLSAANYVNVLYTNTSYAGGVGYYYNGSAWVSSTPADNAFKTYVTQNDTALTLPSGYDQYALIGWVYNDSGSNFDAFVAQDRRVLWLEEKTTGTFTAQIATLIDLSAIVPPMPVTIAMQGGNNTAASSVVATRDLQSGNYVRIVAVQSSLDRQVGTAPLLIDSQIIYVQVNGNTGQWWISEWEW